MYAGFWSRLAAGLLDLLILLVPTFLVPIVVALTTGPKSKASMAADVSVLLLYWLYFAGMESSRKRATFGKAAFGICVVDMEGNRIGFLRATGRLFAKILSLIPLGIGFLMAGVMPRKQALHDIVAGSLVVKRDALPSRVRQATAAVTRPALSRGAPEGIRSPRA